MDILVTYKPNGIKTHRSSENDWGFLEWLEEKLKIKLYLFHRLDQGTSGLLLLAKNESTAAEWTEQFKNKLIKKSYLFITQKNNSLSEEVLTQSQISKVKGKWISEKTSTPNSETKFSRLKSYKNYQLWKAEPKTGKAHQIRLHAQDLGISILGDDQHGGDFFFRLCLHAAQLENKNQKWEAAPPVYFNNLSLLENLDLCRLLDAYHLRQQLILFKLLSDDSYRLSHIENNQLRIDSYGNQLWIYDYGNKNLSSCLEPFFNITKPLPTWIREMKNRGENPLESSLTALNNPEPNWIIQENKIQYELRSHQGLSPGLFLDQRENRQWVREMSFNKSVLNLFSYTCGFSLCAAMGDAKEVVSVDVSQNFLDWGKTNFKLNNLNPENYEFRKQDSMEFLRKTIKIKRQFDLIICDPPSFGRTKKSVFNIEKDLSELAELCFQLLKQQGILLLSTNFEKWNTPQFIKKAEALLDQKYYTLLKVSLPGLDFLEPNGFTLKTLLIQRT